MPKSKNLKGKNQVNRKMALIFVAAFAVVGGAALYVSHAARLLTTTYQYIDPASYYITPTGASQPVPATLVNDAIYVGSSSVQVATLNAGDVLTWGGKGGQTAHPPTLTSWNVCFTMRTIGNTPASLQVGKSQISIRPTPDVGYEQNYWQYSCVNGSNFGTIKLLSGGPLHMYRTEIQNTYSY